MTWAGARGPQKEYTMPQQNDHTDDLHDDWQEEDQGDRRKRWQEEPHEHRNGLLARETCDGLAQDPPRFGGRGYGVTDVNGAEDRRYREKPETLPSCFEHPPSPRMARSA